MHYVFDLWYQISEIPVGAVFGTHCCQHSGSSGREVHLYLPPPHKAGEHSICLSTNYTPWFSHTHIQLHLDIVIGSTKPLADVKHD